MVKPEPMEEEYNELPPPLTPYIPEVNLEIDEGSPGNIKLIINNSNFGPVYLH